MALGKGLGAGAGAGLGFALGGPAGAALGTTIGGAFGGLFDSDNSEELMKKALEQYEGIVPPDLARAIVLTQYQQGGSLTPEQMEMLPVEAQQAVQIAESPEMRQKQEVQRQALEQLSRTGMGPQELLNLEKIKRTTASDAQARLQSLMGKYQQMGQAGGGASLAAALQSNQAATDAASMEAMQMGAQAAENRRSAIKAAYDAASGMRATDLSVEEKNVENQRQKQMFDIQNALARQKANVAARAEAQRYNVGRQQDVADLNVGMSNKELYRQREAQDKMYQNQMDLAKAKAAAYTGQATAEREASKAQGENWQNLIGGVSQGLGAWAQARKDKGLDPWSLSSTPVKKTP